MNTLIIIYYHFHSYHERFANNLCKRWTFLVFPKNGFDIRDEQNAWPLVVCVASNVDSRILVPSRYLETRHSHKTRHKMRTHVRVEGTCEAYGEYILYSVMSRVSRTSYRCRLEQLVYNNRVIRYYYVWANVTYQFIYRIVRRQN